jgi:hypothetical protein
MPSTTASFFTALAIILALVALGIYFFGIPPEVKRKMEEKTLKTMGENKASYIVKGKTSFTLHVVMKHFANTISRSNLEASHLRPRRRQTT